MRHVIHNICITFAWYLYIHFAENIAGSESHIGIYIYYALCQFLQRDLGMYHISNQVKAIYFFHIITAI